MNSVTELSKAISILQRGEMLPHAQSSVSCFKQHNIVNIVCVAGVTEMSAPLHTARQQSVSLAAYGPHSLSAPSILELCTPLQCPIHAQNDEF